jgi:hypothetical protein
MIFTSISWHAYFIFIGLCIFTWYLVIYFTYFKRPAAVLAGLKNWLHRQPLTPTVPATADRSLKLFDQAKKELVDFLENAGIESWEKPEVAQSLSILFDHYRPLHGTHYTALLGQVINDSKYKFNSEELEKLWNN